MHNLCQSFPAININITINNSKGVDVVLLLYKRVTSCQLSITGHHEDPTGFSCCHLLSPGLYQVFLVPSGYRVTLVILTRSDYTPGTPGAPWTQWELLKTRAKLWRLYSNNDDIVDWTKSGKFDISDITGEMHSWEAELGFFPAKVLRLRWV